MGTTLFAMVKLRRSSGSYLKVLSDDGDIFSLPDGLKQSISYDPATLLNDDEWYCIARISEELDNDIILPERSSSACDGINHGNFDKIVFLCSQQDHLYHFQQVTRTHRIKQKRVYFGENCKYEEDSRSIPLKDYADAIYDQIHDVLYFRKLSSISTIFDGIDKLYREATDEEVKEFLDFDFIELGGDYMADHVGKNNRKKITSQLEKFKQRGEEEKKIILDETKKYCPSLVSSNGKFRIGNDNDLKNLLYGINQQYYTTKIDEELRIANSIKIIGGGGKTNG